MHVVHVVPALFGRAGVFGGAERYAYELAKTMAEKTRTTLVSFGARDDVFRDGALEVRVIGRPIKVRGQRENPFSFRIVRWLASADVIHCHQRQIVTSTFCAVLGRLARRPVFVTALGGGGWDLSAYVRTDRLYRAHLHISEYAEKIERHPSGTRTRVILGGVDTERFCPSESVSREPAVLFVGRLLPHKGIDVLVRAVSSDTPTWLVGTEAVPRYREDLARLARGKRVEFLSGLDDAAVVERYRRASVLVLPSVYRNFYGEETLVPELLGQTLIEAMACGTPVIGSNVASLPEIIEDGVTGFLVPPNDPTSLGERIEWLLSDPIRAQEMGRRARQRVLERFTWNAVVDRCLLAYGER
jgi:glycosyltransferase involved in cell wall biosynthesis